MKMGIGKWLAEKYLEANKLSGKIVETVGEVAGDIVQGTGHVAADIAGAVGLDTASDLVRNTTKTVGKNISGAAKVVSGTNTALARAIVDTAGEILDDEDLSLVAWEHEQEIDVLDEIEEIHNTNKKLAKDYSEAGKKALKTTGETIGATIRLVAETVDNFKPDNIPANRGVVISFSGRWGVYMFHQDKQYVFTILTETFSRWNAGDIGFIPAENFGAEYHFLKSNKVRLIVDGKQISKMRKMPCGQFGIDETEKFILELCGLKQISEIEAQGYRKTKIVIPTKEEIEFKRRERIRRIRETINRELNEKRHEIEEKYSQEIERAEMELKDVSDEVLFKIISNQMLPSYRRLAAQKILEERERNIYRG